MNNSNYKTIGLALFTAVLLAIVGEWYGFGAMVAVAIIETYREHRYLKLHFHQWEIEQEEREGNK